MKLAIVAIVLLMVLSAGIFYELPGVKKDDPKFRFSDLMDDYDIYTHTFKSYNEDQNITLQDYVKDIRYDIDLDRTLISFKSRPTRPLAFSRDNGTNDLTSNYFLTPGDSVTVDVSIHKFSNGEETLEEWMYELKEKPEEV